MLNVYIGRSNIPEGKDLIFDVVERFIDELETIEKDISKTKVLL